MPDRIGHRLADEIARRNAPVDFGQAEYRFVGGDREIARDQRREPTAKAPSVDHCDGRLRIHAQQFPLPLACIAANLFLKNLGAGIDFAEILLQIHARRPRLPAPVRTTPFASLFERLEHLDHFAVEGGAHRIALLRPVECYPGNAPLDLDVDRLPITDFDHVAHITRCLSGECRRKSRPGGMRIAPSNVKDLLFVSYTNTDGSQIVRSACEIDATPGSVCADLVDWAQRQPDVAFLAQRRDDAWETLEYGCAFDRARNRREPAALAGLGRSAARNRRGEQYRACARCARRDVRRYSETAPLSLG